MKYFNFHMFKPSLHLPWSNSVVSLTCPLRRPPLKSILHTVARLIFQNNIFSYTTLSFEFFEPLLNVRLVSKSSPWLPNDAPQVPFQHSHLLLPHHTIPIPTKLYCFLFSEKFVRACSSFNQEHFTHFWYFKSYPSEKGNVINHHIKPFWLN